MMNCPICGKEIKLTESEQLTLDDWLEVVVVCSMCKGQLLVKLPCYVQKYDEEVCKKVKMSIEEINEFLTPELERLFFHKYSNNFIEKIRYDVITNYFYRNCRPTTKQINALKKSYFKEMEKIDE